MKSLIILLLALSISLSITYALKNNTYSQKVEKFGIGLHGYVIGKTLNTKQRIFMKSHLEKSDMKKALKFKDNSYFITVNGSTNRVLAVHENFFDIDYDKTMEILNKMESKFGKPTLEVHGTTFYWIIDQDGLVDAQRYKEIKNAIATKQHTPTVTVKFNTDTNIYTADNSMVTNAYYIISSTLLLEEFINN